MFLLVWQPEVIPTTTQVLMCIKTPSLGMWFALDAALIEQANIIVGDGKFLDNFVRISSNLKIRHTPVPGFDCCNIYDRSDTL